MTMLLGANDGWRGRHVGCFGIMDSFQGGNGDAAGDKLLLSPANVSSIRKRKKKKRGGGGRGGCLQGEFGGRCLAGILSSLVGTRFPVIRAHRRY